MPSYHGMAARLRKIRFAAHLCCQTKCPTFAATQLKGNKKTTKTIEWYILATGRWSGCSKWLENAG
jgi:hypothetical protein